MTGITEVRWPTCDDDGCIGIRLAARRRCLAHARAEERDAALRHIGETGEVDLRGVPITTELLRQVLTAVADATVLPPVFTVARFDQATFQGAARFESATFEGPAVFTGASFHGDARFEGATFEADAGFQHTTFHGDAHFTEATFRDAWFSNATFRSLADFSDATLHTAWFMETTFERYAGFPGSIFGGAMFVRAMFKGGAHFGGATFHHTFRCAEATFEDYADFQASNFHGLASFGQATFQGPGVFVGVTFHSDARFGEATFKDEAAFVKATFRRGASFREATFGDARFDDVEFRHDARFEAASFERTRQIGPLVAHQGLVLDDAQFAQAVRIEVSTTGLCCRRARFPDGVQFRLRWARVELDDTDFPAPSILTGIPRLASDDLVQREERIAKAWQRLMAGEISERPRLMSLQRTNVAGLGVSNVDMADCRFSGAHNLDKLRLEPDVGFATAPSRAGRLSQGGWRQVIAEERAWRASQARPWWPRWTAPRWPDWPGNPAPAVMDPGQIAGLYRALRKGREDTKDEPGAADFYYGEMEMRRHAQRPAGTDTDSRRGASWGRVERSILTAYWLVSGYGLRAWRALATLAAVVLLAGVVFAFWGFAPLDEPTIRPVAVDAHGAPIYANQPVQRPAGLDELPHGVRFSAQAATALLRGPDQPLTALGEWLYMALRLLGPVLLGLAILALRGRVKR